jgi:hypothetical protein
LAIHIFFKVVDNLLTKDLGKGAAKSGRAFSILPRATWPIKPQEKQLI